MKYSLRAWLTVRTLWDSASLQPKCFNYEVSFETSSSQDLWLSQRADCKRTVCVYLPFVINSIRENVSPLVSIKILQSRCDCSLLSSSLHWLMHLGHHVQDSVSTAQLRANAITRSAFKGTRRDKVKRSSSGIISLRSTRCVEITPTVDHIWSNSTAKRSVKFRSNFRYCRWHRHALREGVFMYWTNLRFSQNFNEQVHTTAKSRPLM